jgi:hypothetical protein
MITGLGGGGSEVGVAMLRDLAVNLRAMFSLLRWNGVFFFRLRGGIHLHPDCTELYNAQSSTGMAECGVRKKIKAW